MRRAIQLNNHPFRFLLYLEWGLLAVAIVSALEAPPVRLARRAPPAGWGHSPLAAVLPLIIFGLLGLHLPLGKLPRIAHAAGQIALILLASIAVFNDGRTFPFVYLILVIRSCLMFGLAGRIGLAIAAFILFVVGLQFRLRVISGIGRRLPPSARERLHDFITGYQLNFIVLFGLSLLLVVLLINALLIERQSQQRLHQANRDLHQSAREIEKLAMDRERSRIARDIHDSLGHSLTALNIQLESALKLWAKDPPAAQRFLGEAKRLGSQSLQEVRQSVAALEQDPLSGQTLEEAIAQLCRDLPRDRPDQSDITLTQTLELSRPLPAILSATLYRIVQEGLTNIVKHAQASHVRLHLVSSEAIATLTLEDDGIGFEPSQARAGSGLRSMRDRAEATGGTFTISSAPGQGSGTRLQVSLPVPPALSTGPVTGLKP